MEKQNESGKNSNQRLVAWSVIFTIISGILFFNYDSKNGQSLQPIKFDVARAGIVVDNGRYELDQRFQRFNNEIQECFDANFSSMDDVVLKAAKKISSYGNCLDLIYYAAKDSALGGNSAGDFVQKRIGQIFETPLSSFMTQVNQIVESYHTDARKIWEKTLYQLNSIPNYRFPKLKILKVDYNKGEEAEQIKTAINECFDRYVLLDFTVSFGCLITSGIIQQLVRQCAMIAVRIFAGQVARISVSIIAAIADGPLPIGDALAGIGFIYTAWEISSKRGEFQNRVQETLNGMLYQEGKDLVERLSYHAEEINLSILEAINELEKQIKEAKNV